MQYYQDDVEFYDGDDGWYDDYLVEEDDAPELPPSSRKWPRHGQLPPTLSPEFIKKHSIQINVFKKPAPPDPTIAKLYDAYMAEVTQLEKEKGELEKKQELKLKELKAAEAQKPATYGSKWSNVAKNDAALVKRLEGEATEINQKLEAIQAKLKKLEEKNKSVIGYIEANKYMQKLHTDYINTTFLVWDTLHGKHTPISTLTQVVERYNPTIVQKESGLVVFQFQADKIGKCMRELRMGGIDDIQRLDWDHIAVYGLK